MRPLLFVMTSLFAAACATTPADEAGGTGGPGGKADDTTSSCPVDGGADAIIAAIEGGGSCYTAAGIAEACAFGSSIDVQFVSAATEVCARGFGAMSAEARADHDALIERCSAKFADAEGTLYRSMTMFCQLEVTHLFSTLYPAAESTEPVVAYSETCPVADSDAEAIEAAIAGAEYCGQAADIAEACAWGSSIDVQFVAAASATCAPTLTEDDVLLRDRLHAGCAAAFADEGGTLGRSMVAYCGLQVAVVLDSLYAPVE